MDILCCQQYIKNYSISIREFCQPRKKYTADRYCACNPLIVLGPVYDCETYYGVLSFESGDFDHNCLNIPL
jgi:hypothetical protein